MVQHLVMLYKCKHEFMCSTAFGYLVRNFILLRNVSFAIFKVWWKNKQKTNKSIHTVSDIILIYHHKLLGLIDKWTHVSWFEFMWLDHTKWSADIKKENFRIALFSSFILFESSFTSQLFAKIFNTNKCVANVSRLTLPSFSITQKLLRWKWIQTFIFKSTSKASSFECSFL